MRIVENVIKKADFSEYGEKSALSQSFSITYCLFMCAFRDRGNSVSM